jgi:hypothetical protein
MGKEYGKMLYNDHVENGVKFHQNSHVKEMTTD